MGSPAKGSAGRSIQETPMGSFDRQPMGQTTLPPAVPVPTEHIEHRWHGRGDLGHVSGVTHTEGSGRPQERCPPAPAGAAAYLQVAVDSFCSTLVDAQITLGKTVEEIAVFVSRAVLLKNFPHFRFKKGHVHVDGHHLQPTQHTAIKGHRGSAPRGLGHPLSPLAVQVPVGCGRAECCLPERGARAVLGSSFCHTTTWH